MVITPFRPLQLVLCVILHRLFPTLTVSVFYYCTHRCCRVWACISS